MVWNVTASIFSRAFSERPEDASPPLPPAAYDGHSHITTGMHTSALMYHLLRARRSYYIK